MNLNKLISLAVEESKKSIHKQKVGCIIFDKNKIISKGYNHPQKSVRSLLKKFQRWEYSVHAEISAVIRAKTDLNGMSMMVVRINNFNRLMLAKPCEHCMKYIDYVGIRKVYYSIGEYPYIQTISLRREN